MNKKGFVALLSVFFVLVALVATAYFLDWEHMRYLMPLPVLYLAVAAFAVGGRRDWWLPLGLLFSAAGDVMGTMGMFVPQVACFALAQLSYIIFFLRGAWLRPGLLFGGLAVVAVVVGLGFFILPKVGTPVEKGAVLVYMVVISLMCVSAILSRREYKGWFIAGALLFLISDAAIALDRFVIGIPFRTEIIMAAYYAAQVIFAGAFMARFLHKRKFNPAIMA